MLNIKHSYWNPVRLIYRKKQIRPPQKNRNQYIFQKNTMKSGTWGWGLKQILLFFYIQYELLSFLFPISLIYLLYLLSLPSPLSSTKQFLIFLNLLSLLSPRYIIYILYLCYLFYISFFMCSPFKITLRWLVRWLSTDFLR